MAVSGYSGKALGQKLGIRSWTRVKPRNAPGNYKQLLGPVPTDAIVSTRLRPPVDLIHIFSIARAHLLAELRRAIEERVTTWEGSKYTLPGQVSTFGRQLGKYSRGIRDNVRGQVRRDRTGRDLGYPGGRQRPPRLEMDEAKQ